VESKRSTKPIDIVASEEHPKALLSWRVPHIIHEVGPLHNITNIVKEKAPKQFDELKIEETYISDFAIEIISSSIDVFQEWQLDFEYDQLSRRLSTFLYEIKKPFPGAISIVASRIIIVDEISQLDAIVKEYKLEQIEEGLFSGGEGSPIRYNMFNFISSPWRQIFLSNPIASLAPEKLSKEGYYKTMDELSFLLSMIHALGKFYVISESIKSIGANLEWSSWYLDDLFENYESKFCWFQRNFSNIEKGLHKVQKEIKSEVLPLSRLVTSPESINLIERVYGVEYVPYVQSFLSILRRFEIEKYKVPVKELINSIFDDLKSLARCIHKFWEEFSASRDSWKELRRSTVTRNQLLITLFGILTTLFINILLKLFS
jgi:hypothetical protein